MRGNLRADKLLLGSGRRVVKSHRFGWRLLISGAALALSPPGRGFHQVTSTLEDLRPNVAIRCILPDAMAAMLTAQWFGSEALELTYETAACKVANEPLYRHDEARFGVVEEGRPWGFDRDGDRTAGIAWQRLPCGVRPLNALEAGPRLKRTDRISLYPPSIHEAFDVGPREHSRPTVCPRRFRSSTTD